MRFSTEIKGNQCFVHKPKNEAKVGPWLHWSRGDVVCSRLVQASMLLEETCCEARKHSQVSADFECRGQAQNTAWKNLGPSIQWSQRNKFCQENPVDTEVHSSPSDNKKARGITASWPCETISMWMNEASPGFMTLDTEKTCGSCFKSLSVWQIYTIQQ